jgi:hypothetical protein
MDLQKPLWKNDKERARKTIRSGNWKTLEGLKLESVPDEILYLMELSWKRILDSLQP